MTRRMRVRTVLLVLVAATAARGVDPRRVTPAVEVVREQGDAVVNVSATHVVESRGGLWEGFFDAPRRATSNSVGSGAIVHSSGYVLTNAHVVARASELDVLLRDGRRFPASLVAQLPDDDVAVVKIDVPPGTKLPTVRLGRSDDLMVGETVIAIGNPVGLQNSVTAGILSAVDRSFDVGRGVRFEGVLQIDAAINPGNSGGPLFNAVGEMIGVNTAIRGDAQNVGFAIPIDRVKALLPRLLAVESRGRARLGLSIGGEAPGRGVVVGAVEKGAPADRAGLQPGMVIAGVAGRPTLSVVDALVALLEQPVGRPFVVRVVLPEGTIDEVKLALEERPKPDGAQLARARLGVGLQELDAARAATVGLRRGAGLLVVDVDKRGPAAAVGLQAGDLIVRVGPYGVKTLDQLGVVLEQAASGTRVGLRVVRFTRDAAFQVEVELVAR
jgi:serine protease Do